MKLCVALLSIKINTYLPPMILVNFIVFRESIPTTELELRFASNSLASASSSFTSSSLSSAVSYSQAIIIRSCRYQHQCPGVYFSSHLKHKPFSIFEQYSSSDNIRKLLSLRWLEDDTTKTFRALVIDIAFVYGNTLFILLWSKGRRFKVGRVGPGTWVGIGLVIGQLSCVFGFWLGWILGR